MTHRLTRPMALAAALALSACGSDDTEPARSTQAITACDFEPTFVAENPAYAWTPNAIRLTSERLTDTVFAIYDADAAAKAAAGTPAATSGGFVIGRDGVLMVETMINKQLFCQAVALIRAQTDKPIIYAINTSHHGDHSYGNTWLPADVRIVQHAATADFIGEHFAADVAWMQDNFGDDQGLDEAEPRAADIVVDASGHTLDLGGGVTVEAQYQGFGQTHGDLFVYVPGAEVMFTGNPLISAAPAIPWLLDGHASEVHATLARVRDALPSGARVVPGHGPVLDVSDFTFSLDYLDALISTVQASVDAGHTLEETVAATTLDDFTGYALWGWVHEVVNVPATYAELSAMTP